MSGLDMFQAYLLSRMRAKREKAEALGRLGISSESMRDVRVQLDDYFKVGHGIARYFALLGDAELEMTTDEDPYRARLSRFVLPLWPELDFRVYSSLDDIVGEVCFAARRQRNVPGNALAWAPWSITEAEAVQVRPGMGVGDYWPPMKDYELVEDGKRFFLCFDYGLLQVVAPASSMEHSFVK